MSDRNDLLVITERDDRILVPTSARSLRRVRRGSVDRVGADHGGNRFGQEVDSRDRAGAGSRHEERRGTELFVLGLNDVDATGGQLISMNCKIGE